MSNIVKFLDRNWIRAFSNVLQRYYYPTYRRVDTSNVKVLQTEYGSFNYSQVLQNYPDLFEQIKDYHVDDLRPDDVVLDIGANVGAFTVMAAQKVKSVIAVEPLFFDELQANVALNNLTNVTCLPYALGAGNMFEISFCGKRKQIQSKQYEEIRAMCPEAPTVLKTDCEGGEWSVYPSDLTDNIRVVEAEIHNFDETGRKTVPMRYVDELKNLGFSCEYLWTPDRQIILHARR